jgi:hypothetical protein
VTFLIFVFWHTHPECFSNSHKAVILSEAPRRSIAQQRASGAESKDPEDACWPMLFRAFRPQNLKEIKKVTTAQDDEL